MAWLIEQEPICPWPEAAGAGAKAARQHHAALPMLSPQKYPQVNLATHAHSSQWAATIQSLS